MPVAWPLDQCYMFIAANSGIHLGAHMPGDLYRDMSDTTSRSVLHRTTRRVSLTEDGEAFLPCAVDLLESVETARASVGAGTINPQGQLIQVLKDYRLKANTAIWAVYPSSRQLAPKVRAFIDYCAECFGDTPYWENAYK